MKNLVVKGNFQAMPAKSIPGHGTPKDRAATIKEKKLQQWYGEVLIKRKNNWFVFNTELKKKKKGGRS